MQLDPFYPIVPDTDWLARLLPLGVKLVQLRVKDASPDKIKAEVERAVALVRDYDCQLVINDYWREAIEAGADFVHLGQEDLANADLAAIRAAGIRIGISTHSREELEIAFAADANYIALGPIFETKLKQMPWKPQGLGRVPEWRARIAGESFIEHCPLVAIGGITLERAPSVLEAGADSVAVITDIVTNSHPDRRIGAWLEATAPWRKLSTGSPLS